LGDHRTFFGGSRKEHARQGHEKYKLQVARKTAFNAQRSLKRCKIGAAFAEFGWTRVSPFAPLHSCLGEAPAPNRRTKAATDGETLRDRRLIRRPCASARSYSRIRRNAESKGG
jgi:hypothetical protein